MNENLGITSEKDRLITEKSTSSVLQKMLSDEEPQRVFAYARRVMRSGCYALNAWNYNSAECF